MLRARSSVFVDLPAAGIVARVEAPGGEEVARTQVWVATLLAQRGSPVATLFRPETQPILVGDVPVTLWHRLGELKEPGFRLLGQTLRAFHRPTRGERPQGAIDLDPFVRPRNELAWPSAWSGSEASAELSRRLDEIEQDWAAASRDDPLGSAVVHGDVHADNIMLGDDGPVLIDLEDAGFGPASWDFVPLTVQVRRYGLSPASRNAFLAGYGVEAKEWPGFDLMCQLYEILSVAWAMRCSADSSLMADEARIRVDGLLHGSETPWRLL